MEKAPGDKWKFRKFLLFLVLLISVRESSGAVNAQDKLREMARQAQAHFDQILNSTEADRQHIAWQESLADPLSLQFAVLRVTDSLSHKTGMPNWQAMLRALGGDHEILRRFVALRPRFAALDKQLNNAEDLFNKLNKKSRPWSLVWPSVLSRIDNIANLHEWFDRYQLNAAMVNKRTLRDYAETVHSKDGATTMLALEEIHNFTCPEKEESENDTSHRHATCADGIFDTLHDALTKASDGFLCSLSKSPHQVVYDLYTLLALTDAKGYAMMQFSWMLLRLYGKGNFTLESDIARADFEHRMVEKALAAKNVLSKLSTWFWKCDPPAAEQRENETYLQITELLQGYLVNEVDLNRYNTCKESCSSYTDSQEIGCFSNQFCSKSRRCSNGRIYNCGFIEADASVCMTDAPGRRFDWVEYKSGRLLGRKSECDGPGQNSTRVDSWWRWLFWHCSYCVCLCDQPSTRSDRYVSLVASLADTADNQLVTGVKFVKDSRVVHIQIQQGAALPRGAVNASTLQWKAINPIEIPSYKLDSLEDGPNYVTLRYEERSLDLDDLMAPDGHVITGVRFRKLGGHLNLEIQVSPINFTTGLIDATRATWISNDNTPASEGKPRTKLSLISPDIPTRSPSPSVPDSQPEQYIDFQASSLDKDVSQTTVPFLDAQPVSPTPSMWITGVGLYHKGQPGFGGYIGFRLATLNVTDYLLMPNKSEQEIDLAA